METGRARLAVLLNDLSGTSAVTTGEKSASDSLLGLPLEGLLVVGSKVENLIGLLCLDSVDTWRWVLLVIVIGKLLGRLWLDDLAIAEDDFWTAALIPVPLVLTVFS